MSDRRKRPFRVLLITLSACLFLVTVGKVTVSISGNYGSPLFTTLDDISNALFLPWLLVLLVYLFLQEKSH